jgi:hypothetical protein
VSLRDDGALVVEDWIESAKPHRVELLWHAPAGAAVDHSGDRWLLTVQGSTLRLQVEGAELLEVIEGRESPPQGWVSTRFYQRAPAPVLSARAELAPGRVLRTVIERQRAHPGDAGNVP